MSDSGLRDRRDFYATDEIVNNIIGWHTVLVQSNVQRAMIT